ncbi:ABC transporter transmembrane domain-containing protein [Salinicola tamaricis]|uniref:ABC transporter transmembrane domain-containing protein n=1 Tax=Salinicola tamaricis TaxID=1771309 RepID=UPI001F5D3427|nr:ABC transporter transmembrane domain-containing protein [Salinicola tamaricis]
MATLVQLGGLAWIVAQAVIAKQGIIELWPALLMVALTLILRAAAQWGQEVSGQACGLAVKRAVRAQLLAKLHALGPVRLASRHSAGLASQLVDQVESLEGYYARFRPQVMLALAVPLLYLAVVLWLNWLAAVWLLIAAPLIPLFMALIGMGAQRLNEAQFRAVTRLSGHFLDRVRGITTLQLFGLGERATAEVSDVAHDYRRRSMRTLRVAFLSLGGARVLRCRLGRGVAIYIGLGRWAISTMARPASSICSAACSSCCWHRSSSSRCVRCRSTTTPRLGAGGCGRADGTAR